MIRGARALFATILSFGAIATVARARVAGRSDAWPPPALAVLEQRLDNGMIVLVAPDPTVSSVVVHVRYNAGVADEPAERAGYTHLVEKLMAMGSVHVKPRDFDARIDATGGWSSSTSDADHLSVFEQVPAGALELALFLEAERMAGLADGIRDGGLAQAKEAISAERRSAYEVQPVGLVARAAREALWPAAHGNAHDVLGDGRAVPRATRESVRAFVRDRITPRGTTVVITGNVDGAAALALVEKYFNWIPSSSAPTRHDEVVEVSRQPSQRRVAEPIATAVVAYRANKPFTADAIDLEVAARVLASGPTSRLHRALVDRKLATEVHAELLLQRRGNELRLSATAADGVDPARLAMVIEAEVGELRDHELAAGVVRGASVALDAELVTALENLAFRADMIAAWSAYAGDPRFFDRQRQMLAAVTPQSVQRAAHKWLGAGVTVLGRPEAK